MVFIVVAFVIVQTVVVIPYLFVKGAFAPSANLDAIAEDLERDGLLLGLTELAVTPVVLGLVAFAVWARRGPSMRDYLGLRPVPGPVLLRWLLAVMALSAAFDLSAYAVRLPAVTDWMLDVVRTAVFLPLLVVALVILAPLVEETLFRGFLFEGLRHSRMGDAGAVAVAALLWGLTHLQYGWFYIAQIVVAGLLLGLARIRTRSLLTAILMHALMNVAATLQAVLQTSRAADP